MEQKEFYTTGEIAKLCGVNFRTVLRWIHKGELKAYRLPGGRGDNRIKRNDLLSFLTKYELPIPEGQGSSNRILIVDDDARMAKSIQRLLKKDGFDVIICTEGFKAGVMVTSLLPRLVVLDLHMPGMGGLDILKYIRSLDNLKCVKILVVSAMPQKELESALKIGADDALRKPFDTQQLLEGVRALIRSES